MPIGDLGELFDQEVIQLINNQEKLPTYLAKAFCPNEAEKIAKRYNECPSRMANKNATQIFRPK
jgi:hypothetical protein